MFKFTKQQFPNYIFTYIYPQGVNNIAQFSHWTVNKIEWKVICKFLFSSLIVFINGMRK